MTETTESPNCTAPIQPANRRLNVFSIDPAADAQLDTARVSRTVVSIPWESVTPGPIGDYLEVVDIDPASGCAYDPVDLDHPHLLGQDGHAPSTGNPQFHQQMVYAVAMKTIKNFEQVLGREIMWAERERDEQGRYQRDADARFVSRLRVYPHALREANAYYSPIKKALLFGYFHAPTTDPRDELPGGMIFTCLSHDIIAHETTHAILDGIHPRLLTPSNADMLAFHEAFADIVAIFQHFTLPGLLLDQVKRTRGYLQQNNLLAQLAAQFARATNRGGALRNALGEFDAQGRRIAPDPAALANTQEPHERGAILVAAVFDAFLSIYENRVADLRRIATGGTGILPDGDIHPDLAHRFADEAKGAAQRVLNICIRAIDYLPPVDITFGDYLRGLITADADFFPEDPCRYRLSFIESFRERGIYPADVMALAEDSLRWRQLADHEWNDLRDFLPPPAVLRMMASAYDAPHTLMQSSQGDALFPKTEREFAKKLRGHFRKGQFNDAARVLLDMGWRISDEPASSDHRCRRRDRFGMERLFAVFLHGWITFKARHATKPGDREKLSWHFGLDLAGLAVEAQSEEAQSEEAVRLQVHAVRPTIRLRPDGRSKVELVVVLTQRVHCTLDDVDVEASERPDELQFKFRGGCTLIINPDTGRVRYAIAKSLLSSRRLARNAAFYRAQIAQHGDAAIMKFGLTPHTETARLHFEPFALVHGGPVDTEGYGNGHEEEEKHALPA